MSRLQRGLSSLNPGVSAGGFSRIGSMSQTGIDRNGGKSFEDLKRLIHSKLVDKLDLSRNDAGCWGGSWSMANFQPTGSGPRITVVHVPRTAVSGSSITIAANAALR